MPRIQANSQRAEGETVFTAPAPDVAWCGDMTEIRTDEGKLYL
ncbi:hypothetical protein [Micromonospora zamorensis]